MYSLREKRNFLLLDGFRGVAAIIVAILHMPRVFGGFVLPNAHLAVDFFLQLSGFIIAFAFADRVNAGLSFTNYIVRRINRLFPAYVLGFGLGLLVAAGAIIFGGNGLSVAWTVEALACAVLPNALMLPQIGCGVQDLLFPINPPMWSIFYEILANVIFFTLITVLLKPKICLPLAIGLLCVLVWRTAYTTIDVGFGWSDFGAGFVRIMYSFLVGVMIFNARLRSVEGSDFIATISLVVLALILGFQTKSFFFEVLMIACVFPAMISCGVCYNPISTSFRWVCAELGKLSYVLYVIHKPVYQLIYGAIVKVAPAFPEQAGMWLGVVVLAFLVFLSWAIATFYEPKARMLLDRAWLYMRGSRQAAAP